MMSFFLPVINKNPASFAKVYNNRGLVYLEQNRPDEALRDLNTAIASAPGILKYYFNRAAVYRRLGRYDDADAIRRTQQRLDRRRSSERRLAAHSRGTRRSHGEFVSGWQNGERSPRASEMIWVRARPRALRVRAYLSYAGRNSIVLPSGSRKKSCLLPARPLP